MIETLLSSGSIATFLLEQPDGQKSIKKVLAQPQLGTLKQLEAEVTALQTLNHPMLPKVLEYNSNGKIELIREYRAGNSLGDLLKEGTLFSQTKVLEFGDRLLDVLEYIHDNGILHRDIKPSNIIYNREDQCVSLVDFGIAKLRYFSGTTTTTIGGSFPYMAPEQYQGKSFPASDIYALGATLIELLTGHSLDQYIQGESLFEQHVVLPETIDPSLRHILTKMTATNAKERFQSAKETRTAWQSFMNGEYRIPTSASTSRQLFSPLPSSDNVGQLVNEYIQITQNERQGVRQPLLWEKISLQTIDALGFQLAKEQGNQRDRQKIYTKMTPNLFSLFVYSSEGNLYYVKLKEKKLFEEFCVNTNTYLSLYYNNYWNEAVSDAWQKNPHHCPKIRDELNKVGTTIRDINDISDFLKFGSFIGGVVGLMTAGHFNSYGIAALSASAAVAAWKATTHHRTKIIKNIVWPQITAEEFETTKPYLGKILTNESAILAAYEEYKQER